MKMFRNNTGRALERSRQYAVNSDFCAIFHQQTDRLYLLAYLLTGTPERAEECLVGSVGDCIEGNPVFKNWANAWSVRTIIKQAIRMIAPLPQQASVQPLAASGLELAPEAAAMMAAISQLSSFERFAFVMSVLEGLSDRHCAALVNCAPSALANARLRALQQIKPAECQAPSAPTIYELPFSREMAASDVA